MCSGLGQRFIDAALVISERAAALQHQGDLLAVIFPRDGVHGPGFLGLCSGVIGPKPRDERGCGAERTGDAENGGGPAEVVGAEIKPAGAGAFAVR